MFTEFTIASINCFIYDFAMEWHHLLGGPQAPATCQIPALRIGDDGYPPLTATRTPAG